MRRVLMVLAVALVMAAMMIVGALPAFAHAAHVNQVNNEVLNPGGGTYTTHCNAHPAFRANECVF